MGKEVKTKALVLHEMPIGDYDKRLILLTKDFGKVTAFSKGSRKPSSHLLAGSQTFAYGDYVLYAGRQSYTVGQINLLTTFHGLRSDIERLSLGLYILELSDFISVEGEDDVMSMQLVLKALQHLERGRLPMPLVIAIYELKMMVLNGYKPTVRGCMSCGSAENLNAFSTAYGGCLCNDCRHKDGAHLQIDEAARLALDYVCEQSLDLLFKFELEDRVLDVFANLARRYVEANLNKRFRSLEFLKFQTF